MKPTEEDYNVAGNRKSKREMGERPNNDSPLLRGLLVVSLQGKKYTVNKMS